MTVTKLLRLRSLIPDVGELNGPSSTLVVRLSHLLLVLLWFSLGEPSKNKIVTDMGKIRHDTK